MLPTVDLVRLPDRQRRKQPRLPLGGPAQRSHPPFFGSGGNLLFLDTWNSRKTQPTSDKSPPISWHHGTCTPPSSQIFCLFPAAMVYDINIWRSSHHVESLLTVYRGGLISETTYFWASEKINFSANFCGLSLPRVTPTSWALWLQPCPLCNLRSSLLRWVE